MFEITPKPVTPAKEISTWHITSVANARIYELVAYFARLTNLAG
jgi:hypothetical protein